MGDATIVRRQIRDELIHGFLAINAMLREETKELRRLIETRAAQTKHNPNWRQQPRAPRGTTEGGQWVGGAGLLRVGEGRRTLTGGDAMDGADAAMFGEMVLFESTRRRYIRALLQTQDPQARMRIANDRAMLARQVFGSYAGEEVDRIYAAEMRTRRGRIALGGTDLSQRALRFRQQMGQAAGDGRNVTVIEYADSQGRLHYIERVSRRRAHAEELAVLELQRLGIRPRQITRVYTDREPCSERCRDLLRGYRRAFITWAVDWPDDEDSRTRANETLQRQIRQHYQMESQDTLPMPLPRQPRPARTRPARRPRRR